MFRGYRAGAGSVALRGVPVRASSAACLQSAASSLQHLQCREISTTTTTSSSNGRAWNPGSGASSSLKRYATLTGNASTYNSLSIAQVRSNATSAATMDSESGLPTLDTLSTVGKYLTSLNEYSIRRQAFEKKQATLVKLLGEEAATAAAAKAGGGLEVPNPPPLEDLAAFCNYYNISLDPAAADAVATTDDKSAAAEASSSSSTVAADAAVKAKLETATAEEKIKIYTDALEAYSRKLHLRLSRPPKKKDDEGDTSMYTQAAEQSDLDKAANIDLPIVFVAFDQYNHTAYLHIPAAMQTIAVEGYDDDDADHFDIFSKLVSHCHTSACIMVGHSEEDQVEVKKLARTANKCGFQASAEVSFSVVLEAFLHLSKKAKLGMGRIDAALGPEGVKQRLIAKNDATNKTKQKVADILADVDGTEDDDGAAPQTVEDDAEEQKLKISELSLPEQLTLLQSKATIPVSPIPTVTGATTDAAPEVDADGNPVAPKKKKYTALEKQAMVKRDKTHRELFFHSETWTLLRQSVEEASINGVIELTKLYTPLDKNGKGGTVMGQAISAVQAVNLLAHPRADVLTVGLTAVGRGGRNLSVLNLRTGRRTQGYGSMESIVDGLLKATSIGPVIIVPNTSADLHDLRMYKHQLKKFGRQVEVVNCWHLVERFQIRVGDAGKIRDTLCEKLNLPTADLIFKIKARAALQVRARVLRAASSYLAAAASTGRLMMAGTAAGEKLGMNGEAQSGAGEEAGGEGSSDAENEQAVVHPTVVKEYLAQLYNNKARQEMEEGAMQKYGRFLLVSIHRTEHNAYRRIGNPHSDLNYAFAMGFSDYQGNLAFPPQLARTQKDQARFPALVGRYDVLVMHDAQANLLQVWEDPELQRFLAQGGKVWCTKLAEFYLKAQRAEIHDLVKIATSGYGVQLQTNESQSADKNAVEKRTLSEVRLDVTTELICLGGAFFGQLKAAVGQVQLTSIGSRFDALLGMVEMERTGIYVDETKGVQYAIKVRSELEQAHQVLKDHAPPQIPLDYFHLFEWHNHMHLDSYFFGGEISFGRPKYTRMDLVYKLLVEMAQALGKLGSIAKHPAVTEYLVAALKESKHSNAKTEAELRALTPSQQVEQLDKYFGTAAGIAAIPDDLVKYRLVVFDLETTGLDIASDRILEYSFFDVTAAREEGGDSNKEKAWFNALINPGRSIAPEVVSIHGIDEEMVANCPRFGDITNDLMKFLRVGPYKTDPAEKVILLSHSTWAMDEPMLRQELLRHSGLALGDSVFFADTFQYFSCGVNKHKMGRAAGDKGSLSLKNLKNLYGIEEAGEAHRASADVRVCWKAMLKAVGVDQMPFNSQYKAVLDTIIQTATLKSGLPNSYCALVPGEADAFIKKQPPNVTIQLPGIIKTLFPYNYPKLTEKLKTRHFDNVVLQTFASRGCIPAQTLLKISQAVEKNNNVIDLSPCETKLNFVYPDSCLRQTVGLTSVITTRTTSSNPSAHSIPKSDISDMRKILTSRYGDKGLCVEIDYATLEIAVQAVLCKDTELLKVLNGGVDYHLVRASWLDDSKSYEEMLALKKEGDKEVIALRRKAKKLSFMRLYGAGASLMSKETQIPIDCIKTMIKEENERYPSVTRYQALIRLLAMRAQNPGLPTHYVVELPTGMRVSYDGQTVQNNLPALKNYPIQGYAAELVQTMVGKLFRHLQQNSHYDGKVAFTNFVHDSVWFDCHESVVHELVADATKILGSIKTHMESTYPNVEIPLQFGVSTDVGRDMFSMMGYERYAKEESLADKIQAENNDIDRDSLGPLPDATSDAQDEAIGEEGGVDLGNLMTDEEMLAATASKVENHLEKQKEVLKQNTHMKPSGAGKSKKPVEKILWEESSPAPKILWEVQPEGQPLSPVDKMLLEDATAEKKAAVKNGVTNGVAKKNGSQSNVAAMTNAKLISKFAAVKSKVMKKAPVPTALKQQQQQRATQKKVAAKSSPPSKKKVVADL